VILVDTSVWVDHFRNRRTPLAGLLDEGLVVCHPFVVGEIALGSLKNRREILELLSSLPAAAVAGHDDAMALASRRSVFGKGIGWVDLHLIASALIERLPLWTLDRRLAGVAREMRIAWEGA
jgi:predicted nucleic acid-binding protein